MKEQKDIGRGGIPAKHAKDQPLANEQIRFDSLQVIGADGVNLGVLSRFDALKAARDAGLDLILLAESGGMGAPVAKIMDYGKELYAKKKKQNEAKKNQKVIQIKEVKMRPKIGTHDYEVKMNQTVGFLEDGKKVKITLTFGKGREMATRNERGLEMFARINKFFEERDLLQHLVEEKDLSMGAMWSKIYFLKKSKG